MDNRNFDAPITREPDPWRDIKDTGKEIQEKLIGVDYSKIVGGKRVVLLGDSHANFPIREHLARHAAELKKAGITHYGIEAQSPIKEVLDKLNNGQNVDLSQIRLGPFVPGQNRSNFEVAVRALAEQGIKIIAFDIDQSTKPSSEDRESHITNEILQILGRDERFKMAVLIGSDHMSKKVTMDGAETLATRLGKSNIPYPTVRFAGGIEAMPLVITKAVRSVGLENREFMLDFKPYENSQYVPYRGEVDWVIHLPQQAPPLGNRLDFARSF